MTGSVRLRPSVMMFLQDAFITVGLGWFCGSWVAGKMVDARLIAGAPEGTPGHDWQAISLWPVIRAGALIVFFRVCFRDHTSADETPPKAEGAPQDA